MIYNTIISPYFNYCNLAWGSSTDHAMRRLLYLQKRAIRLVLHADYFAHTKPLFLKVKLLNVLDLCNYSFAIFMYLCFNNFIPISLSSKFCLNSALHSYNTRSSSNFHLNKTKYN